MWKNGVVDVVDVIFPIYPTTWEELPAMLEWAYLLPNSQQVRVRDCYDRPRILPVFEMRRPGLDSRIARHLSVG